MKVHFFFKGYPESHWYTEMLVLPRVGEDIRLAENEDPWRVLKVTWAITPAVKCDHPKPCALIACMPVGPRVEITLF